jgi:hypothetical protein
MPKPSARPKNRWLASAACGATRRARRDQPPMARSAPAIPAGLRVNCTAEASARNSRWRQTAAWIRLPKKTPAKPTTIRPNAMATTAAAPPPSLPERRRIEEKRIERSTVWPSRPITRMPCSTPIRRMFRRMSPLRMWLYSCATTPCNCSRDSNSTQPRVTPMTASSGV